MLQFYQLLVIVAVFVGVFVAWLTKWTLSSAWKRLYRHDR
jgi:hypothetical protein